ncbi:hypothetical protein [Kribbella sp. NPDC051718]|uniref:hypothetical protein n=1 Tax=Kribbella sp. NPDC051718 TaxID=3155168 RepID=UPI0034400296
MTEMTTRQLLWDSLSIAPAGRHPGRVGVIGLPAAEFTVSESIKHSPSVAGKDFDRVNALGHALQDHQGSGFERTVRSDAGQRMNPGWLTTRSLVHDPAGGRIAAAAHLNHTGLGLPPALDLGAMDGRNMISWREHNGMVYPAGNLYCGSDRSGALVPALMNADIISVDLWPSTGSMAMFESWGGSLGSVALIDGGGSHRLLTFIDGVSGGEELRFSPDGGWLLLDGGSKAWLVEVVTGRWMRAPVENAAWWPLRPATLISVSNEDGSVVPRLYDLSSAEYVGEFPQLYIEGQGEVDPACWGVAVSPGGDELLVGTRAGITAAYQGEHGSRTRAARVTLATGRGQLVWPIFVDDQGELEREHHEFRWLGPVPELPVTLAAQLSALLQEPSSQVPEGDPARYGDEAKQSTGIALDYTVQQLQTDLVASDGAYLMPEIVRGLATLQSYGGEHWDSMSEWATRVAGALEPLVSSGSLSPRNEDAWRVFCSAVRALNAGSPSSIDWAGLPWVRG